MTWNDVLTGITLADVVKLWGGAFAAGMAWGLFWRAAVTFTERWLS